MPVGMEPAGNCAFSGAPAFFMRTPRVCIARTRARISDGLNKEDGSIGAESGIRPIFAQGHPLWELGVLGRAFVVWPKRNDTAASFPNIV